MYETVEKLTAIIRAEADIIDKAFALLLQHVDAEDLSMVELVDGIADISAEVEKASDNS